MRGAAGELNHPPSLPPLLMRERPDKKPGMFKDKNNKAGNTKFVDKSEVVGTLKAAFEYLAYLEPGIARALYTQFVLSEVHPFMDGNGRLSRIMMNAELVKEDHCKIIVPTVHRDNYLNGLRLASRDKQFKTYCKTLDHAQAYTASIHWQDYGVAREKIEKDCADNLADEGLHSQHRAHNVENNNVVLRGAAGC